jgi:hypothetical protein
MRQRQFTMKIEDGLLAATKRYALEHGLTVSDVVRDHLSALTGWTAGGNGEGLQEGAVIEVLNRYSAKELSRGEAMSQIGLRQDETQRFAQLMNENGITWPSPDGTLTRNGVAALLEALDEEE